MSVPDQKKKVERVQTGVRIEKRVLKVLKAVAAQQSLEDRIVIIIHVLCHHLPPF